MQAQGRLHKLMVIMYTETVPGSEGFCLETRRMRGEALCVYSVLP